MNRMPQPTLPKLLRMAIVPLLWFVFFYPAEASPSSTDLTVKLLDSAAINDTVIRLSDIASLTATTNTSNLERLIVGESAPAGFRRFINSDEIERLIRQKAPNLVTIDIANKRVAVATISESHSIGEYLSQIRNYVKNQIDVGESDFTLVVQDTNRQFICLKRPFTVDIQAQNRELKAGSNMVELIVKQGTKVQTIGIVCKVAINTNIIIATREIARGELLDPQSLQTVKRILPNYNLRPCFSLSELSGKRARRTIAAGTMICRQFLEPVPEIESGDNVTLKVNSGSIIIAIDCIAREKGSNGQTILVENPQSHSLIKVKVIRPGLVVPAIKGGV